MISEETKLKDLSQTDYCILLQVENTFFAIDGCTFFENSPTILFTPPHSLTAESTLPISNSWCVRNTAPYKSIIEVNPGLADPRRIITVTETTSHMTTGTKIPNVLRGTLCIILLSRECRIQFSTVNLFHCCGLGKTATGRGPIAQHQN